MNQLLQLSILIFSVFIFSSCSNIDDSKSGNESNITVTIDGQQYIFNTIKVSVYEDEFFISRNFWAKIDNEPYKVISFSMTDYPDSIENRFIYSQDGKHYSRGMQGTHLNSHFTTNTATELIGTFSGKLYDLERDSVTLEHGAIHIVY